MKIRKYGIPLSLKLNDIIAICFAERAPVRASITCCLNELSAIYYNFCTGFPQNLWKNQIFRALSCLCALLICCTFLSSCTFFKSSKKTQDSAATGSKETKQKDDAKKPLKPGKPTLDNFLIDKGDEEVVKKFGEPTIVSRTADNRIIWTYRPSWKLLPDNKDTVYVEFENGKVTKIIRAK
jgi:hypothetical protein